MESTDVIRCLSDHLFEVGLALVLLHDDKLIGSGACNLEEGVTGHLHDAWVVLFHELKELPDDRFEEGPVVP